MSTIYTQMWKKQAIPQTEDLWDYLQMSQLPIKNTFLAFNPSLKPDKRGNMRIAPHSRRSFMRSIFNAQNP